MYALSRGQPFLINALADAATTAVPEGPIGAAVIDEQAAALIMARTTHLYTLNQRLQEPRVARVIQAIMLGDAEEPVDRRSDDFAYVVDLGLIDEASAGIANPIYREVIARQLTLTLQGHFPAGDWPWAKGGRLEVARLVDTFLRWWRETADAARRAGPEGYPEVLPHLAFMAFLHRVVNGGGRIEREYAAGRGRNDLLVTWGDERHAIELKRIAPAQGRERVVRAGCEQLAGYLDTLGLAEGWLVVFDQRPGVSWEERLWAEEVEVAGKALHLRGA